VAATERDAVIRVGACGRLTASSLVDTVWGLRVPSNCVTATLRSVRRHDAAPLRFGPTRGAPPATPEPQRRTQSLPQKHSLFDGGAA
jgi:hypothetical protein